jgi:hypothetical protein
MDRDRLICIQDGAPWITTEFPAYPHSNRLGVANRFWERAHVFSKTKEYAFRLGTYPRLTRLQIVLARTIFNPVQRVDGQWVEVGSYDRSRVVSIVRAGLEHDDDIIQQWFTADEVIKLLEASTSYEEMLAAADAIDGGCEGNPETRAYVERVLGRKVVP